MPKLNRPHIMLGKPQVISLNDPHARVALEAELVVRGPGLKLEEVAALAWCAYETPSTEGTFNAATLRRLVRENLLEISGVPSRPLYRCTEIGTAVVQAYAKAGFLGREARKRWKRVGQSERYALMEPVQSGSSSLVSAIVFERDQ